jgi:hypothetical protein
MKFSGLPPERKGKSGKDLLKTFLPVITFALGCLFTWALKANDEQNQRRRDAVTEVCRLCKDWYTQIQVLEINAAGSKKSVSSDPAIPYLTILTIASFFRI